MTIRDGDVALLARQAVDLLDPDLDVRIEPDAMSDPYRLARSGWTVHPLLDVRPTFGIHLVAGMTPAEALARLIGGLSDGVTESSLFWARVFPTCRDHPHPAVAGTEGDEVVIRCPDSGEERARLSPERPGA